MPFLELITYSNKLDWTFWIHSKYIFNRGPYKLEFTGYFKGKNILFTLFTKVIFVSTFVISMDV